VCTGQCVCLHASVSVHTCLHRPGIATDMHCWVICVSQQAHTCAHSCENELYGRPQGLPNLDTAGNPVPSLADA
jgi:hypothetical protein